MPTVKEYPHFHIDVYDLQINVIIDNNWQKIAQNIFDKEKVDSLNIENAEAYACKIGGRKGFYMFFNENASNKIIYHECMHMILYVAIARGLDVNASNKEHIAYLAEYIIDETMKIRDRK